MYALAIEYDEMWHGEILIRIKWGLHRVKNYLNEEMKGTFNQAKLDKVDVCMKMTNLNWKKISKGRRRRSKQYIMKKLQLSS